MILPTPGPLDYTRMFGSATPPDGAGPIGENGAWPQQDTSTKQQVLNGLNPLQYVPVVGMVYRAATHEEIPMTMRVAGAGLLGGPLGMIGAAFMGLLEQLITMGPDTSRPPTPVGMAQTGSEAGMEPVTPGTVTGTQYTTLATVEPEFLNNSPDNAAPDTTAIVQNGATAYQSAAFEWQRAEMVEKGLA